MNLRTWAVSVVCGAVIGLSPVVVVVISHAEQAKVPLDLYVMSQCPWGVKAEDVIIPVVKSLGSAVVLNLYFIADEQPAQEGQGVAAKFRSLHGEPEVLENIRQICAIKHAPGKHLDYILERNKAINDSNWQDAAKRAGLDPAAIERCVSGPEGVALFAENLKAHRTRKATGSPTIDIDGKPYTGARGVRSISLAICQALKDKGAKLPEACQKAEAMPPDPVPQMAGGAGCGGAAAAPAAGGCGGCGTGGAGAAARPPRLTSDAPVAIRIVTDKQCRLCTPKFAGFLTQIYPKATVTTLDMDTKEGKAVIERLQATRVPVYLVDRAVEGTAPFEQMRTFFVQSQDGYLLRQDMVKPEVHLARKRVPGHIDLFVSPLTPTSAKASAELLQLFHETKPKGVTFSLHMIVQETAAPAAQANAQGAGAMRAAVASEIDAASPGPLISAGGQAEFQESLRQTCLFQHASLGDLFTYVTCRSQELQNAAKADGCLSPSAAVTQCLQGPEGEALLRQDARLAREWGIAAGGPVLVWENRYGPFPFYEVDSLGRLLPERR